MFFKDIVEQLYVKKAFLAVFSALLSNFIHFSLILYGEKYRTLRKL